nr:MAG: ORF1 [Torque teno polar bear virus 8]
MPYRYRRRRRIPRRRHQFYYRRRRHIRRGRRRFWRGRRYPPVRSSRPRRVQWLSIRGFEFLGIQGSEINFSLIPETDNKKAAWTIDIKNVATTNKEVIYFSKIIPPTDQFHNSCNDQWAGGLLSYWDFVGGFGQAEFTFRTLLLRAIFGFARISRKLEGFQYIKFIGYKFNFVRAPTISYLFLPEPHRGPNDYEKSLIHPANLLNTKGTIIVHSVKRTKCCKNPRFKKRADPTTYGWYDIEEFMNRRLTGYVWSVFDPNNPMGRNSKITNTLDSPVTNNWFQQKNEDKNIATYCPKWMNREEYDSIFVKRIDNAQADKLDQTWWDWVFEQEIDNQQVQCDYGKYSPFLEPIMPAPSPETLWFRYVFFFQLGGSTFGRNPPSYPVKETDVCTPCHSGCNACIYPEDLDAHGLLKKKAYERIIRSPQRTKKRAMALIARALRQRKRKRERRVTWADEKSEKRAKLVMGF